MSEHQLFLEDQELPTCDDCQITMGPAPRDCVEPGPEHFGHQIFECPECKKTVVVSFLDAK
jgi:hypothetical protein